MKTFTNLVTTLLTVLMIGQGFPQSSVTFVSISSARQNSTSESPPPVADSPTEPQEEEGNWLAETLEVSFADRYLQEALAKMGPGVTNAFLFVRDRIGYEAYGGSLRGARGTLWSEAGNSLDQASLLVGLLRAQGIGARYVRGTLAPAAVGELVHSLFDPVIAADAVGYIPATLSRYHPEDDSELFSVSADHWWVELEDGTQLDPSFPVSAIGQVRGSRVSEHFEVPDELRHKVTVRERVELHNLLSQYSYETPLEVTLATAAIYGRPLTLGHFTSLYQPPAIVAGVKTYTYTPYLLVDDHDDSVENDALIRGGQFQEFYNSLIALANSSVTRVTLEFATVAPGKEPVVHSRDLLDRVGFAARHGLAQPQPVDTTQPALSEYDLTTVNVLPGWFDPEAAMYHARASTNLQSRVEALSLRVEQIAQKEPNRITATEHAEANQYGTDLRLLGVANTRCVNSIALINLDYWTRHAEAQRRVRAWFESPRLVLTQLRVASGVGTNEGRASISIDLRKDDMRVVPYPGQSKIAAFGFNMARGLRQSVIEHLVLEEYLNSERTLRTAKPSAVAVFTAAKEQNIPIEVLQGSADIQKLENLQISAEAKARITLALLDNHAVNVPVRMVNVAGGSGIAWYEIDAATGQIYGVTEDGGHQNITELVIIISLVGLAGVGGLVILSGNIKNMFSKQDIQTATYKPFEPFRKADLTTSSTAMLPNHGLQLPVVDDSGSDLSVEVNGQVITAGANLQEVLESAGSSGSIIDYAGTEVEVVSLLSLDPAQFEIPAASNAGFNLVIGSDPSFVVKKGETHVPSAFRARIGFFGAPAPTSMSGYRDQIGQSFIFQVTGSVNGGNIWGTDYYTPDSAIASAAVHAGVVSNGQTAVIKISVLPGKTGYLGTTRNGVTSRGDGPSTACYRLDRVDPAMDQASLLLAGSAPDGWNLLFARATNAIPAGTTNDVSLFLQPEAASVLPGPGAMVPFTVELRSADTGNTILTQRVIYTVPEVHDVVLRGAPEVVYVSPQGAGAMEFTLINGGNVAQQVPLRLQLPTNFTASALPQLLDLEPGQVLTQAVTLTAQGAEVDTDYYGVLGLTYGPANGLSRSLEFRLRVSAPGSLQALQAGNNARALGRTALARTLESLGEDLSQLYQDPSSLLYHSRVLSGVDSLAGQLEKDPLLATFSMNMTLARDALKSVTGEAIIPALEALGIELQQLGDRTLLMAGHDFVLALQPNTGVALPEVPTRYGLVLRNNGTRTTKYTLSLSDLPPGVTGGLNTNQVTLSPGEEVRPGLVGAQEVFVTLTHPAQQLTAFSFTVTATAEAAPEITRSASGSFTAREELVKVVTVQADPAFIVPLEKRTTSGVFTGGDSGEGLDLDGEFLHAINYGVNAEAAVVRDADFVPVIIPFTSWRDLEPSFGDTQSDNALEEVMSVCHWAGGRLETSVTNLTVGRPYKLQLLFMENEPKNHSRELDVLLNGEPIADSFSPPRLMGGAGLMDRGAVLTHEFIATNSTLAITLLASAYLSDPVLYALTIEALPVACVNVSARVLNAVNADQTVRLQYAVKNAIGETMFASAPQEVPLSVLSSLDTFDLGALDPVGLPAGNYGIEVTVRDLEGEIIPGSAGAGSFVVGSPVSVSMRVAPDLLPAGDGQVDVQLDLRFAPGPQESGLRLAGLVETPGEALTLALRHPYAYVGGTTNLSIIDISDPGNPVFTNSLGAGERWATMAGENLLVRNGTALEVYGLTDPLQPNLLGSVESGIGITYPTYLAAVGPLYYQNTLIFGWSVIAPLFARGDMLSIDLSNPSAPVSLGLLYNTPHSSYGQFVGSEYFIGQKSDHRSNTILLPSTSGKYSASESGVGRLLIIDAQNPGAPAEVGQFEVPGTRVLQAIAIHGERALVVGNTGGFHLLNNAPVSSGSMTLTLLDVSDPRAPEILSPNVQLTGIDQPMWEARVFAGPKDAYFITDITQGNLPALGIVDTGDPQNIQVTFLPVPAEVKWAEVQSNFLFSVSSSGLAIYDLGLLAELPVTASVRVPTNANTSIVPGSFSVEPSEVVPGDGFETLVWRTQLSKGVPTNVITWKAEVRELEGGEGRPVTLGGSVDFRLGAHSVQLELPVLRVAGEQKLALAPAARTNAPGREAMFDLTVRNASSNPITYTLRVSGIPAGWVELASQVTVPAQGSATVPLAITSEPFVALAEYGFVVQAEAPGIPTSRVEGSLTLAGAPVVDSAAHGLVLSLDPADLTAGRGCAVSSRVRLTNTGNTSESVLLTVEPPAGVAVGGGPFSVTLPPGLENYREVELVFLVEGDASPGLKDYTVHARMDSASAAEVVARGTLNVLPVGVLLSISPELQEVATVYLLRVENRSLGSETFDLMAGGPLAPYVILAEKTVNLEANAFTDLLLRFTNVDLALPDKFPVHVVAAARSNTNVHGVLTGEIQVHPRRGVAANIQPARLRLPGPGRARAVVSVQNTGNAEDVYLARVLETSGALTAHLAGPTQPPERTLRLPGLSQGLMWLEVESSAPGQGTVTVQIQSLEDSKAVATVSIPVETGIRLLWALKGIIEVNYTPVPAIDHYLEYTDTVDPAVQVWSELPGGPYNRGWYYLHFPPDCPAVSVDYADTNRLFLECASEPARFYRIRVPEGLTPPPLTMTWHQVQALQFEPVEGYDHFIQYCEELGPNAVWHPLPRGPHNHGLGFDLLNERQRFYRLLIQPKAAP